MRQQISISVSEELYRRLEEYRESLNLSEVFRDAIQARLDEIESRRKDPKTMTVIERLKKEKKELGDDSIQAGKKAFDAYLANTSYSELLKLLDVQTEPDTSNWNLTPDDVWDQLYEVTDTDWRDWEKDIEGLDKEKFILGFFDRLHERWETELKEQLE